ncbi:hypothetical protein NE865_07661 [Phthorimaea operculella]|nr:hypothetical protein NE865_07661 [Phthorimaea operculella]
MGAESGGHEDAHMFEKIKRKFEGEQTGPEKPAKMSASFNRSRRGLFKDYNHIYVENGKKEYPILLTSASTETKMDILKTNGILRSVLGVDHVKAVGMSLIKVFFKDKENANKFLLNQNLLHQNGWIARVPYDNLEVQGIIRVPIEITEEELLQELKSSAEVIGVKRFMRKAPDGSLIPTQTVLVTMLGSVLPDHVTYDHIWFDTKPYIKPLRQCYTCYKFDHGRGSCRSKQVCSLCAGPHFFKECDNQDSIKCVNCQGPHSAVSVQCPQKAAKIANIKQQINGKVSYASAVSKTRTSAPVSGSQQTPLQTPQRRAMMSDILNSDTVLASIIKTVMDYLSEREKSKGKGKPLTSQIIKELLIANFTTPNG